MSEDTAGPIARQMMGPAMGPVTGPVTGPYDDGTPPGGPTAYWQNALNQNFPQHARRLRDRPRPIPVWARIEWERDGEEWIPGKAIRWDRAHVLVRVGDRRSSAHGFWLSPADVRRRHPDTMTETTTVTDATLDAVTDTDAAAGRTEARRRPDEATG